jgi:hypothetical protein
VLVEENMALVPDKERGHRMEIVLVLRMEIAARIEVAVVGSQTGCRKAGIGYPKDRS